MQSSNSTSIGVKRRCDDTFEPANKKRGSKNEKQNHDWNPDHDTILIITKAKDNKLVRFTRQLAEWLIFTPRFGKKHPFTVYVDAHLKASKRFGYEKLARTNPVYKSNLKFWTPKLCYKHPELFHLIISLGGDGTILFTSTIFQTIVPPIMPFHLGSLGFLAPFTSTSYHQELDKLFNGQLNNTSRIRLSCTVYRYRRDPYCLLKSRTKSDMNTVWTNTPPIDHATAETLTNSSSKDANDWMVMETAWMKKAFEQASKGNPEIADSLDDKVLCYSTVPDQTYHVLNEIVVDRGPSSNISMLELFADERHLTTVQADGLCIATATGSTAYSLSAGGSLTHPDMQCTLVTPICPHTLSFRPMLLPSRLTIRIVVPFGSRHTAYCSFDGRNRTELKQGDHVKITLSPYPVKTYCSSDSSNDWFSSVQSCLQWNMRQRQKSFVVVEGEEDEPVEARMKSKSLFACLRPKDVNKVESTQDSAALQSDEQSNDVKEECEEDEDSTVDLIPWTAEELEREPAFKSLIPNNSLVP